MFLTNNKNVLQFQSEGERVKIEEINKLAEDENKGELREPDILKRLTQYDVLSRQNILSIFVKYIVENPSREKFLNSIFGKRLMSLLGVNFIENIDPSIGMYHVNTVAGEGNFFDAHRLFESGQYPNWVAQNHCFGNAYLYALKNAKQSRVVSGIAYVGKPFLHSIVLTKSNYVVDFNYNIVMTAGLYFNLINFEPLAEVNSKDIKETYTLFNTNRDLFQKENFQTYAINFAFEDILEHIKKQGKGYDKRVGE